MSGADTRLNLRVCPNISAVPTLIYTAGSADLTPASKNLQAARIFCRPKPAFIITPTAFGCSPLPFPPSVHLWFLALVLIRVPGATLLKRSVVLALVVISSLSCLYFRRRIVEKSSLPVGQSVRDQVSDFLFRKPHC